MTRRILSSSKRADAEQAGKQAPRLSVLPTLPPPLSFYEGLFLVTGTVAFLDRTAARQQAQSRT